MKIDNDHVLSDPIIAPTKLEQDKIVSFLESIDRKIESTQDQLDNMKEWKKGLLQKMFV
jgi:type I restriction enzyme S subunit